MTTDNSTNSRPTTLQVLQRNAHQEGAIAPGVLDAEFKLIEGIPITHRLELADEMIGLKISLEFSLEPTPQGLEVKVTPALQRSRNMFPRYFRVMRFARWTSTGHSTFATSTSVTDLLRGQDIPLEYNPRNPIYDSRIVLTLDGEGTLRIYRQDPDSPQILLEA